MTTILVEQKALLNALTMLVIAIAKRCTLPVLHHVRLEASGETLTLSTTDLETYATVSVPALCEGEGVTTVNYKEFVSLVKSLKGQTLLLSMEESMLHINTLGVSSAMTTIAAAEFPALPQVQDATRIPLQTVTLPISTLRQMVEMVWYAASPDATWSGNVQTAICASVRGGILHLAASDKFRLACMQESVEAQDWPFALLIPAKALYAIVRKLPKQGDVTLSCESSVFATLTCGTFTASIRLVEGQYPAYERIIPAGLPITAQADVKALHTAMKSVEVIAKDNSNITAWHLNGAVEITARRDGMVVPMSVKVAAQREGDDLDILLNWQNVTDVTSRVPAGTVTLACADAQKPVTLTASAIPGFVHVVMPMRTNR